MNIFYRKKIILASLFLLVFSCFPPIKTQAFSIVPGSSENSSQESKAKYEKGDYQLNDFVNIGFYLSKYIFGLVGSIALLFFVYGGFMFLISSGSSEKVQQAKTIVLNAIIGLVITFASYIIVQFVVSALGTTMGTGLG